MSCSSISKCTFIHSGMKEHFDFPLEIFICFIFILFSPSISILLSVSAVLLKQGTTLVVSVLKQPFELMVLQMDTKL